jgi:formamidopyrimidine-DNA glycosylase
MPELPEVETTRRALADSVLHHRIERVLKRREHLRWPLPAELDQLPGQHFQAAHRRAKYLLLECEVGSLIVHLGMTGTLRVLPRSTPLRSHDHVDIELASGRVMRFNDPRRFGAMLWQPAGETHKVLASLGPEPLSEDFTARYLFTRARGRSAAIKHFLMDQSIVVGVGNIYAAEALFRAGIAPARAAGTISLKRMGALVLAVRSILQAAIERGGTTLRDFLSPDGLPGYFEQELNVYDRAGEPCRVCARTLRNAALGARQSIYCPRCQR